MMKRYFIFFVFSLFGFFFASASLRAGEDDTQARLEALREIVHKNAKPRLLDKIGDKRLSKEDVEATIAVYEATEKILADKSISEEFRLWTLKHRTLAVMILAYEETPRFFPILAGVIDRLDKEKDCATLLQKAEYHFLLIGSVLAFNPIDKKTQIDLKSLTERIILFAKGYPGDEADILIKQLLDLVLKIKSQSQRDKRFAIVTPLLIQHFIEVNRPTDAHLLMADARRALLPGHPMLIGGFDLEGKMFDTTLLKDKVVLVQFWGTWCPHCKEEIPGLIDLYEKYHSKGLEIIGINTAVQGDENPTKVRQFLATTGFGEKHKMIPWTILHEGLAATQTRQGTITKYYGIEDLPVLILIGRNGLVLKIHPLPSTLDAEIREALNAVELTPEEQVLAEAARKKQESEIDKKIQEELKLIEKK